MDPQESPRAPAAAPPPAASSAAVRKRRLEAFRHRPTLRELLTLWLPTLALVIGAFWVTYHFIQPAPPDHLTITTGAADGAYYQYALRYREILARDGVRLDIQTSSGSVENLARLAKDPSEDNSGADAAFVQGGLGPLSRNTPLADAATPDDDAPRPHSLGTVTYEGLWVFTRGKKEPTRLTDLRGAKLAIGPEGSGSRKVALDLLAAHGISPTDATLSPLSGHPAIEALKRGELDAVFLIAAPDAPVVRELAALADVHPMSFANAAAIAKRFPYLTAVTLTQGVFDLKADLPPHDVQLVATRANLVVRADLHPALAYLLMEAASEVHGGAGLFHRAGEFPAAVGTDFPLATQAESYYKNGRPFLQRYLPYWLANLVQRMLLFLLPVFGVLIPVMKLLPVMINWRRQQRLNRWYGELKFLELDLDAHDLTREQLDRYLKRLAEIDDAARHMSMPLDFSDRVYTLRQHIAFVHERLAALPGTPAGKTA